MNKDITINKIAFCNKCGFLGELDNISGDHLKPSDNQHCDYLATFFSDSDLDFISITKNKKEQLEVEEYTVDEEQTNLTLYYYYKNLEIMDSKEAALKAVKQPWIDEGKYDVFFKQNESSLNKAAEWLINFVKLKEGIE